MCMYLMFCSQGVQEDSRCVHNRSCGPVCMYVCDNVCVVVYICACECVAVPPLVCAS